MTTTVQINKLVLQLGSQGSAVKELQTLMNQILGYSRLTIDGIFGERTKAAVEEMQERFFLVVDGIVGPKTWKALITPRNEELPILQLGSRGDLVSRMQQRLTINGYPLGAIDGDFGAKTAVAVKKFQADRHLAVDGIVGSKTWVQLSTLFPYEPPC